ncbi:MAG: hypothetical protein WCF68_02740 [Terriglobales bacterium]
MSTPKLSAQDWDEIFNALESKAASVERGAYDFFPEEVGSANSETLRWANDLRRIMAKIEER